MPLPEPLEPLVIVIQDPDRVAVQEQPLPAVTVTLAVPPEGLMPRLVGLATKVHDPLCVSVNVALPTVSLAERAADPLLAATLKFTVPFPLPLARFVIVSQPVELVAVHVQPLPAVTLTLPVVVPAPTLREVAETEYAQVGGGGGGGGAVVPNTNWFEIVLCDDPPGPTAATRASYTTPATGHPPSNAAKLKRILPSLSTVGLPSSMTCSGCVPPTAKKRNSYSVTTAMPLTEAL